jgi:hypothetical protein
MNCRAPSICPTCGFGSHDPSHGNTNSYPGPANMIIDGSLRDQLNALVRLQSPEGLWHTVLNDDTSYLETSGSAGIATAPVTVPSSLMRERIPSIAFCVYLLNNRPCISKAVAIPAEPEVSR